MPVPSTLWGHVVCDQVKKWEVKIRIRYENYLKASFFFSDAGLRESFAAALRREGSLLNGPFAESAREFKKGPSLNSLRGDSG